MSKKFRFSRLIDNLIEIYSKYPGVGRKSATRFAYYTIQRDKKFLKKFIDILEKVKEGLKECSICFNLSESDPCPICSDNKRDDSKLCVIETIKEIGPIERLGKFRGKFHILNGVISPLAGIHPEDLTIDALVKRLKKNDKIKEVIIATSPTTEGEVTANYIKNQLSGLPVSLTRIAYGVPVGSDLDFVDEVTLSKAFEGRQEF